MKLKNDAALCQLLHISPPIISKIRNRHAPISAPLLICMREATGLGIRELRALMGDHAEKFDSKSLQLDP